MLRPLVVGGAPLFLALCCAADFAQSAAPAGPAANPLLGKWRFTHQANNCAETYEFRADGTFQIVSDKEVSDGVYRISLRPDENGFFTFVGRNTKVSGAPDCTNTPPQAGNLDVEFTNYVKFHPTAPEHIVCAEPAVERCFGPLERVQ